MAWDLPWHEEQLREDVQGQTRTEFKGDISFSRRILAAIIIRNNPIPEDQGNRLVKYHLSNAIQENESSPVILAMNRDVRNEADAETEPYLRGLLPLAAQDDLDPRSPLFQAKLGGADESSKEIHVECVGDFLDVLMSNMPPMETQLVLKKESKCHTFIRSRVMLQVALSYLKSIAHSAGPAFWRPEHPTLILDGRWDQVQIGHGLDKGYAQGIMRHQPQHVEIAITCSCTGCVALRHASDAVAHDLSAYNTGLGIVRENRPDLVDRFGSTTLDE